MNLHKIMIGTGIALIVFIPIWIFMIVPQLEKLPADFEFNVDLLSSEQTRYEIGEELSDEKILRGFIKLEPREVNKETIKIEGVFHIEYLDGTISYETPEEYEVERNKRLIANSEKEIYFMFHPNLKKRDIIIIFPGWTQPIVVKYKGEDTIKNLNVYKFEMTISNLDLTDSFEFLENVPETYKVLTDAQATYLVEPVSGKLINYEESGTNYYINKQTDEIVQDFSIFSNTFSEDTIAYQVRLAQNEKQKIYLIEWIVPILLALVGIALILASFIGRKFIDNEKPTPKTTFPKKPSGKAKKPLVTFDKNKEKAN